jgi:DNA-directed RNA polymerase I, II, and III subunit RPABC4
MTTENNNTEMQSNAEFTEPTTITTTTTTQMDTEEYPSTRIGSYLSFNYDWEKESKKMPGYICGQCHYVNTLRAREAIRCRECGYRILYKERMRRPLVYSAQ